MRAYWYKNDVDCDQRLPHDSGNDVSSEYLAELGVLYYQLSSEKEVDELAQKRQYRNRDVINVSPEGLGAVYEQKIQSFFEEHIHEDEEIRYVLDGAGYFDVRSEFDKWVRIRLEKNDLIVLPAGIYHRFSTDENNYIKAMRLFKEDPKWTPLNRDAATEANPVRQTYLKSRTVQVK